MDGHLLACLSHSLTHSLTHLVLHICMHTYIHTHIHTYVHTRTHTYISTYLPLLIYSYMHVQNMSTSAATQISDLVCAYACTRQKYVGLLIHTVVTQIAERERETFGVIRGETSAFSRSSKCPYEQRGGPCGRGVSQPPHVPGKKRAF